MRVKLPKVIANRFAREWRVQYDAAQVAEVMALPDGGSLTFPDGTLGYAGHRMVRDGARVALITVPALLRFDVFPRADSFSFTLRNLSGLPAPGSGFESEGRPYDTGDGPPLNEYELSVPLPDGRTARIVVRVPPYTGALEVTYSAVALVS